MPAKKKPANSAARKKTAKKAAVKKPAATKPAAKKVAKQSPAKTATRKTPRMPISKAPPVVNNPFPTRPAACQKWLQLHAARTRHDLRPPGKSLEALKGDRTGQHSILINDRYRLCFIWEDGDAHQVEITDYH